MQFSTTIKALAVVAFTATAAFAAPSPDPEVAAAGAQLEADIASIAQSDPETAAAMSGLVSRQNNACAATRIACDNCLLRPFRPNACRNFHNACVACGGAAAGCRC